MTAQSHVEINLAVCRMLGIADTSNITRVEIVLEPDAYPLVHVTRQIRSATEGMTTTVRSFDLIPHGEY
jgi:hypothetical protein